MIYSAQNQFGDDPLLVISPIQDQELSEAFPIYFQVNLFLFNNPSTF
jgi:hypothetical protein